MKVTLPRELEKFVQEQVQAGNYPSAQELIESAVARLKFDEEQEQLPPEIWEAIAQAEEEFEKGDSVDWEEFKVQFQKRFVKE